MGYIPNHGAGCVKVRSFYTSCQYCGASVVYFECSCGSKVFLDPPEEGTHNCGNVDVIADHALRLYRAIMLVNLIRLAKKAPNECTKCPMCGTIVKNNKSRFNKHWKKCPKRSELFECSETVELVEILSAF